MSEKLDGNALGKIFHHWGPPIICTFLGFYLAKGAFDGVGDAIGATWASISEWAVDPISFPRWFVLFSTTWVSFGGAFLWFKQYQRINKLRKREEDLVEGLRKAFSKAADDLAKP